MLGSAQDREREWSIHVTGSYHAKDSTSGVKAQFVGEDIESIDTAAKIVSGDEIVLDAEHSISWSASDQRRLQSIDELYMRVLQYYNNVHTRTIDANAVIRTSKRFSKKLKTKLSVASSDGIGTEHEPQDEHPVADVVLYAKKKLSSADRSRSLTHADLQVFLYSLQWDDKLGRHEGVVGDSDTDISSSDSDINSDNSEDDSDYDLDGQYPEESESDSSADSNLASEEGDEFLGSESSLAGLSNDALNQSKIHKVLSEAEKVDANKASNFDMLWLNMLSLTCLNDVSERFRLHDMVRTAFRDIRADSYFLALPGSVFFAFCTFHLDEASNHTSMYKVYIYWSLASRKGDPGLVISYEREIMRDTKRSSFAGINIGKGMFASTIFPLYDQINRKVCRLKGVYIVDLYLTRALSKQDPLMDYISHTISYFKLLVDTKVKLRHREQLLVTKQMFVLKQAVAMIVNELTSTEKLVKKLIQYISSGSFFIREDKEEDDEDNDDQAESSFETDQSMTHGMMRDRRLGRQASNVGGGGLKAANGITVTSAIAKEIQTKALVGFDDFLFSTSIEDSVPNRPIYVEQRHVQLSRIQKDHLGHLLDRLNFSLFMALDKNDQIKNLKERAEAQTNLRTINMETLVALMAVLFLPSSMIVNVFSTNFMMPNSDNGFNIYLLTVPWGDDVFWGICAATTAITIVYFHYEGWIDWKVRWAHVCSTFTGYTYWSSLFCFKQKGKSTVVRYITQHANGEYVEKFVETAPPNERPALGRRPTFRRVSSDNALLQNMRAPESKDEGDRNAENWERYSHGAMSDIIRTRSIDDNSVRHLSIGSNNSGSALRASLPTTTSQSLQYDMLLTGVGVGCTQSSDIGVMGRFNAYTSVYSNPHSASSSYKSLGRASRVLSQDDLDEEFRREAEQKLARSLSISVSNRRNADAVRLLQALEKN